MVITTLEAHVREEGWGRLQAAYADAQREVPPQMVRSYLVQGSADPTLWRILTVWRSRAALEEMRASVTVPAGIVIFRAAGAEPAVGMFDVRDIVMGGVPA
ncbi:MAG TPA: antibiotic biosynthesis monooxygenase [Longimicrobiales bacterium]